MLNIGLSVVCFSVLFHKLNVEEGLYVVLEESQDGPGEGTRLKFLQPAVRVSRFETVFTMGVCASVRSSVHTLSEGVHFSPWRVCRMCSVQRQL